MADKMKFVGDFRGAVSNMLDISEHIAGLVGMCRALGWVEADFTTMLASSDVSAAELFDAIEAWEGAAVAAQAQGLVLMNLKP